MCMEESHAGALARRTGEASCHGLIVMLGSSWAGLRFIDVPSGGHEGVRVAAEGGGGFKCRV